MVVVQVGDEKGRNQITIRNSCAEPVEVDRICEPEYTTKEGLPEEGWPVFAKIVDRYYKQGFDCYLELSYDEDNGICIQTLAL